MPLKTLLFGGLFGLACAAALFSPIWGVLAYVGHYTAGPERQWWHAPLSPFGMRYSFTLALATGLGIAAHWGTLRFGRGLLYGQEKLLLVFLAVVWLSVILGPETVGRYTHARIDHPSLKLTKVVVFVLMLTHVVTDWKNLQRLLWVLVLSAMILGMQAWDTPYRAFMSGRLEGVGGPDFAETNFFGTFMASVLWLIGVQFIHARWHGRLLCFVAGGFTANAIILTRSRGAMVALLAGVLMAILAAPRRYRIYLVAGLLLAGVGFLQLTDERFVERFSSIFVEEEERDASAQGRIELAKLGLQMWQDNPLGVGAGNFYQTIGRYRADLAGRDAHNTYIRCLTELGIQGMVLFLAIIFSAGLTLRRVVRQAADLPAPEYDRIRLLAFGMACSLATMLAGCLTMSLTYVEFLWWFVMLPVCLNRATENMLADQETASADDDEDLDEESHDIDTEDLLVR